MSFWEEIKGVEISYKFELDAIRGKRLSRSQIDSAIRSLERYRREVESLRQLALRERNSTAALGRLEGDLGWLGKMIDKFLDTRNRVSRMISCSRRSDSEIGKLAELRPSEK